jgi:ribosomal protein S18 acetylase RimI-like enzyme
MSHQPANAAALIRPATETDLDAVCEIVAEAYGVYIPRMGVEPGPMRADYAALIGDGVLHVAEIDGRVAGILVIFAEPDHLLLDNVAVDPDWQGRGIGRALIAYAEAAARAAGHAEIRLYTHEKMVENQRLYTALGYEETGRGRQDGFDRVFMRKRLVVE